LNVNYAVSNDGDKVMEKVRLRFMLDNKEVYSTTLDAITIGESKRGVGNITIPKDAKTGQTVSIIAEWQGQTIQSNSRTISVGAEKGQTKN
jgi:hypothetical protein